MTIVRLADYARRDPRAKPRGAPRPLSPPVASHGRDEPAETPADVPIRIHVGDPLFETCARDAGENADDRLSIPAAFVRLAEARRRTPERPCARGGLGALVDAVLGRLAPPTRPRQVSSLSGFSAKKR